MQEKKKKEKYLIEDTGTSEAEVKVCCEGNSFSNLSGHVPLWL